MPKKQFALDSNFLYDLADEKDFAHTFREVFSEKGYFLLVPPTVVQELTYAECRKSGEEQRLAHAALSSLRDWKITPFDLIAVGHGITTQFTRRLIDRGLLPEEEMNDGQILAETALHNIPVLVTSDHHLLNMDEAALIQAFDDSDLPSVHPCHPKAILRAVR